MQQQQTPQPYGNQQYDQYQQQPYGQQPYGQQPYQGQPMGQYNNNVPLQDPSYQQPQQPMQQMQPPMQGGMVAAPMPMGGKNPYEYPRSANDVPHPAKIQCPNCNQQGVTRMEVKPGGMTIATCVCLAFVFFPVMCVPFCIDDCQDRKHYCQNCNTHVGDKKYEIC